MPKRKMVTKIHGPLRKIVKRFNIEMKDRAGRTIELPRELLECGHVVVEKSDIYGPTNAERRRCRKCLRGEPAP